jgi:hypothetical protein
MGVGSFAAAKMSGADTKTALGAGLLGGVGGWAAGPALAGTGILGAAGTGASIGSMFGGGGGGEASSGALGSITPSQSAGTPPMPGFATNPTTGATTLGKDPTGGFALGSNQKPQNPGTQEKAQKLLGQLPMLAQMYGMNQGLDAQDEARELERLKAAAEIQASAYRAAPNPGFAPGVALGSFPGVGGGFAFGR